MIATNFRRFPEALALQLCLPFGHLVQWATPRPGSRVLRAIRTARARAAAAAPFVPPWMPPLCVSDDRDAPAWCKALKQAARALAHQVKTGTGALFQEKTEWVRRGTILKRVVTGYEYAAAISKAVEQTRDVRRLVCTYQAGDQVLYMGQLWTVRETNVSSYTDEHDEGGPSVVKPGALLLSMVGKEECQRCVWPGWLSPESY